ncbi:hypothetical protein DKX38_006241 [Salix brachista]|uniref:Flavin-containing monooxygenase n=1 Tax=Salix brachista TaxID=2182728 RepID=A0A5N5N1J1_9ROSI|nr:hypothetical protein DKX38_006241 [Salix brachista]
MYQRSVEFASFNEEAKKWNVKAKNVSSGEIEEYSARFLVVASGETSNPFIPELEGLNTFSGEFLHSTKFKYGKTYRDKNVLVVGSGNSGMEIALYLANHGARTSIAIRSPTHILSREMVYLGLTLMKYFSTGIVDKVMVMLSKLVYGDLSKHGIIRPAEGPFFMKVAYGKYPVFDVGTVKKIKSGEIQVLPALESIRGEEVVFENGKSHPFDAIFWAGPHH